MSNKILSVESIELKILKSNPPQLMVAAHGSVSTMGWEDPKLVPSKIKSVDGIYQYDFVATPPTDVVAQIIMPISASTIMRTIPSDFKGIRIIASSNSLDQNAGLIASDNLTNPEFSPVLENLMGIEVVGEQLKIRVSSGGCTNKDSFRINVMKGFTGVPPYILEVYRVIPDRCRAHLLNGVVLEYNLQELGIEPFASFSLANKIGKV